MGEGTISALVIGKTFAATYYITKRVIDFTAVILVDRLPQVDNSIQK
jgi:hypothetical protein